LDLDSDGGSYAVRRAHSTVTIPIGPVRIDGIKADPLANKIRLLFEEIPVCPRVLQGKTR